MLSLTFLACSESDAPDGPTAQEYCYNVCLPFLDSDLDDRAASGWTDCVDSSKSEHDFDDGGWDDDMCTAVYVDCGVPQ